MRVSEEPNGQQEVGSMHQLPPIAKDGYPRSLVLFLCFRIFARYAFPYTAKLRQNVMAMQEPPDQCGNCTTVPLTTTFIAPTTCSNFWTPDGSLALNASEATLTRNVTADGCLPSELSISLGCRNCLGWDSGMTVSPGVCPYGWTAASVGITDGVTTEYCCPTHVFWPSCRLLADV